jgi:AcrR family transcriptional regulator
MPRAEHRAERQNLIARSAAEIIADEGIEGATFRAIAQRSGLSKGVVEHYFSGKQDIIRKTQEWINQQALSREQRATRRKRGLAAARARMLSLMPVNRELISEWKIRIHYWSSAIASRDEQLGMSLRITGARERFSGDLQQAVADGEIPADTDIQAATNVLLHLLAGVSCNQLADPTYYTRKYQVTLIDDCLNRLQSGRGLPL